MSQIQSARDSLEKNLSNSPGSFHLKNRNNVSPRRIHHNLGSIDLSKLSKAVPKATTKDSVNRALRGSMTTRAAERNDILIFSKRNPENPMNPDGTLGISRVSKKIRLKPLLPKFNYSVSPMAKESSPQSYRLEERRESHKTLQSSSSAKFLGMTHETSVPFINRASMSLKTDQSVDFIHASTPGKLPTITLRATEDSTKFDFDEVRVLFTEEGDNTRERKRNSPQIERRDNSKLSKISNQYASKSPEILSLPKKVAEKKAPIMHFGGRLSTRTIYISPALDEKPVRINNTPMSFREPRESKEKEKDNQIFLNAINRSKSIDRILASPRQEEQKSAIETSKYSVRVSVNLPALKHRRKESEPLQQDDSMLREKHIKTEPAIDNNLTADIESSFSSDSSKTESSEYSKKNETPPPEPHQKIAKKSSIENHTNLSSSAGEKTPPALNLKSIEDESKHLHKKSVTFTDSDGSNSGSPANSDGLSNSSPALKSSLKKAALEGKVFKLSGFAGEILPKKNESQEPEETPQEAPSNNVQSQSQPEVKEEDERFTVFKKSNNVNFFELNEENLYVGGRRYSSVNEIIKGSKAIKSPREDPAAPVIVSYQGDNTGIIIQPKYMETHGSMCFTELWSERSRHQYKLVRKEEIGMIKKVYTEAEDTLYRSDRTAKKNVVQTRMMANRVESSSPSSTKNLDSNRLATFPSRRPSFQIERQDGSPNVRGVIDAPGGKNQGRRKMSLFLSTNL